MKAPALHESSEEPLFLPVLYNKQDGLCISSRILSELVWSVLYDFLLLTPERIPCPFWQVSCCSCIFACYFPCGGNRLRHHECQSMLIIRGVWFYKRTQSSTGDLSTAGSSQWMIPHGHLLLCHMPNFTSGVYSCDCKCISISYIIAFTPATLLVAGLLKCLLREALSPPKMFILDTFPMAWGVHFGSRHVECRDVGGFELALPESMENLQSAFWLVTHTRSGGQLWCRMQRGKEELFLLWVIWSLSGYESQKHFGRFGLKSQLDVFQDGSKPHIDLFATQANGKLKFLWVDTFWSKVGQSLESLISVFLIVWFQLLQAFTLVPCLLKVLLTVRWTLLILTGQKLV